MGMFDWIYEPCPNKECDGWLYTQSKSGPCLLNEYSLNSASDDILRDIDGDTMYCDKHCGAKKIIRTSEPKTVTAWLE